MADTAPFTHQHRAGLHDARRCRSQKRPVSAVMGELCQEALRRGLESAEGFFLGRYAIARVRNDRPISRDGAFPNMPFQRSRSSSIPSFDRLAISDARASRARTGPRRFMIVALGISRPSARHPSSYVVLLEAHDLLPQ